MVSRLTSLDHEIVFFFNKESKSGRKSKVDGNPMMLNSVDVRYPKRENMAKRTLWEKFEEGAPKKIKRLF
jgi:hypothetical protein